MKNRFQGPRAEYTYTLEGGIIALIDLDLGSKSLPNDRPAARMDNVLADLREELGDLAGYAVSTGIVWAVGTGCGSRGSFGAILFA